MKLFKDKSGTIWDIKFNIKCIEEQILPLIQDNNYKAELEAKIQEWRNIKLDKQTIKKLNNLNYETDKLFYDLKQKYKKF